ncbi:hypothetical protein ABZ419_19145 [Streptomyces cinnamoneus]|uniref:hypothetical protein n=1 Tax=Streptomyces cinnamoneus TaxID=53446 RepID=UPI0033F4A145
MPDALSKILSGLTAADVEIDESGRVVIRNQELAQQVKDLSGAATPLVDNDNCNHGCRGQG